MAAWCRSTWEFCSAPRWKRKYARCWDLPVNSTIETFADTGQVFLKNAEHATDLPDVDMKGLTPAQKTLVLKRLNSETCTCGCGLTIAECRINDTACPVSQKLAAQIVQEVKSGAAAELPKAPQSRNAGHAQTFGFIDLHRSRL